MKPITIDNDEDRGLILMGLEHVTTRYMTKLKNAEKKAKTEPTVEIAAEIGKLKLQLAGAARLYNKFSMATVGNAKVGRA